MNRKNIALGVLAALLLTTNGLWAYVLIDRSVTIDYMSMEMGHRTKMLRQLQALAPVSARVSSSKDEVIGAAALGLKDNSIFEKDGFTFVGQLGLRFAANGRLEKVSAIDETD